MPQNDLLVIKMTLFRINSARSLVLEYVLMLIGSVCYVFRTRIETGLCWKAILENAGMMHEVGVEGRFCSI